AQRRLADQARGVAGRPGLVGRLKRLAAAQQRVSAERDHGPRSARGPCGLRPRGSRAGALVLHLVLLLGLGAHLSSCSESATWVPPNHRAWARKSVPPWASQIRADLVPAPWATRIPDGVPAG